jgi:hypothetical protein
LPSGSENGTIRYVPTDHGPGSSEGNRQTPLRGNQGWQHSHSAAPSAAPWDTANTAARRCFPLLFEIIRWLVGMRPKSNLLNLYFANRSRSNKRIVPAKKLATVFLHHVPFHHIVTSCCLAGRPSILAPYLAAKHALHLAVYGAVRPARARDMLIHRFWKQCRHSFRKAGKPVTKTLAR